MMTKSRTPTCLPAQLKLTLLITALFITAGCSHLPKAPDQKDMQSQNKVMPHANSDHNKPLTFAGSFQKMSSDAQKKELTRLNQTAKQDARAKLLLAMAYGLPASRVRDTNKAQLLLEDLILNKSLDEENLSLAVIMQDYISESNRFSEKAKDEQKRADLTQQKLDELQKKLDDLKHIEKTMVDRDQGVKK